MQELFGGNDQPRLNIRGSGIQDNPVSRGVQLFMMAYPLTRQMDLTLLAYCHLSKCVFLRFIVVPMP